jgi:hypothetical protein
MSKPRKMAWADMTDDPDPEPDDVVISKRGIKVKKPVVPKSEPDKKKPPSNSNENDV